MFGGVAPSKHTPNTSPKFVRLQTFAGLPLYSFEFLGAFQCVPTGASGGRMSTSTTEKSPVERGSRVTAISPSIIGNGACVQPCHSAMYDDGLGPAVVQIEPA